jgi:phospholipid transport system substrate-binding protein
MTHFASFPRSPISIQVLLSTMRYSFRPSLILSALALLLTTFAAAPAAAQSQDAAQQEIREMLERRDQEIKSILKGDTNFSAQQRNELKTLINGVIDFEAMGQIALGPFWSDLDAGQREEFVTVFRDIVRAQSLSDLEVYNSKVTYETISVDGDSAFVETVTEYKGTSTPVIYDLAREDGTWVAEDIVVDGVSTAESYARSFQTVIRKRGFDALMTALQKKRDKVLAES